VQAPTEAPEETEDTGLSYIEALEAEIDKLRLDIKRLKSNQSFGYVRGRGMLPPRAGAILPKPVVEALDVSPHDAPHG
jgi:hypothetical protein